METIETEALTIRPFNAGDWKAVQELSVNKMTPKKDPHDHDLPTDEEGCKRMAEWFAEQPDRYFAVCLKATGRLIGFLAFNGTDGTGQLDIGHVIHTEFQNNRHDREALRAIIDHAFGGSRIKSIVTKNPIEWTEQVRPLLELGLRAASPDRPGELGIGRAAWASKSP